VLFLWTRPVGRVHFCPFWFVGSIVEVGLDWLVFLSLLLLFRGSVVIWFKGVGRGLIGGVTIIFSSYKWGLSFGFIVCFVVLFCGSYIFVF